MKEIGLGTAMWGWSVDRDTAYAILDRFYEAGFRWVDTAMNYPINDNPDDFRLSLNLIANWCRDRAVSDLRVICKVGSLSNRKSAAHDLSPTYLAQEYAISQAALGSNLACLMLHWDNRTEPAAIAETLHWLRSQPIIAGLSGIKEPNIYAHCGESLSQPQIQIKHNFLTSAIAQYEALADWQPQFWGYGIAVSGLKLSPTDYEATSYVTLTKAETYHQQWLAAEVKTCLEAIIASHAAITTLYHVGLAYAEQDERLTGYFLAPTSVAKANDSLRCLAAIRREPPNLQALRSLS